jgi:glycosyltransferase involved in cell wall biosynthesis
MPKIALIHYRYGPGGGMDTYLVDLARGFCSRRDEVTVWTYEKTEGFDPIAGVSVHQVEAPARSALVRKISYHTKIVRDFRPSEYDLVVGTMRTTKQHINVNGGTHIGYARGVHGKLKYTDLLPIFFERRALQAAKLIVAHSKKISSEIQLHYKIPENSIQVLYPPSDERRFHFAIRERRPELILKHGIDLRKFTVFFPSTNHEIKGLAPLLEAFKALPPSRFELLIAGAPMLTRTKELLSPLPHVRYLGYIARIEELYAACDVTILPSHYDGFGLVITESLACGTPVIVSKNAGASELIESLQSRGKNFGLVLKDQSAEEIARSIRTASESTFTSDSNFLFNESLTPAQHVDSMLKRYFLA